MCMKYISFNIFIQENASEKVLENVVHFVQAC